MSIQRPSQKQLNRFLDYQQQKVKNTQTGPYLRNCILFSAVTAFFIASVNSSMNPNGIVPRILYEKTLSPFKRRTRHLLPSLIAVGSIFIYDVSQGLWD